MASSQRKSAAVKPAKKKRQPANEEAVMQLRSLAHDLSNALEAILQACYLLTHAKLDADSRRWAHMIDLASQDAARINREIRKSLRELSGEEP